MSFPLNVYNPFSFTSDFLSTSFMDEKPLSPSSNNSITVNYTEDSVRKTMTVYFTSITISTTPTDMVQQESQTDMVQQESQTDMVQQESQTDMVVQQESQTDMVVQPSSKRRKFFKF
jgi:hypothetical protein